MPFHSHKLPNGLQIVGETSPSARSAALGFFVRTGSRDETPEVSGVTHFLEHMVFKGTPHRTALDVNRDFDRIGADYNAFTSEENTVFHAAVLPEYLPQAVDILADILRPSLRGEDFDTEKNVIIEEIGMYEDQPDVLGLRQRQAAAISPTHPLANSMLGSTASIAALTRSDGRLLPQALRRPEHHGGGGRQFRVAGLGRSWSRKRCGGWQRGRSAATVCAGRPGSGGMQVMTQGQGDAGARHPDVARPGGRFAAALRGRPAGAWPSATTPAAGCTGTWSIPALPTPPTAASTSTRAPARIYTSFSREPDQAEGNLAIVRKILEEVQQDGISEEELRRRRNKMLSRLVRGSERPRGRMMAVGMAWQYQGEYRAMDDELKSFETVKRPTSARSRPLSARPRVNAGTGGR